MMPKPILFLFLFGTLLGKAQSPIDSLSVNPNPLIKRAAISYYLVNSDTATLYVLNSLGQVILTVFSNQFITTGYHQDSLRLDNFPDGVYFLILKPKLSNPVNRKFIKSFSSGVAEGINFPGLKIYPNPAQDVLHIEAKTEPATEIVIVDGNGRTVFTRHKPLLQEEIDLSGFLPGTYAVLLKTNFTRERFKVIKLE